MTHLENQPKKTALLQCPHPQTTSSHPKITHKMASTYLVYGFFVQPLPGQSLCPLNVRIMGVLWKGN